MSAQHYYSKVNRRNLHPTNISLEVSQSDGFDEKQHDSSKTDNSSDELSSHSLYDRESPKPYNRSRRDMTSIGTSKRNPFTNLSGCEYKRSRIKFSGSVLFLILFFLITICVAYVYIFRSEEKECSFEELRQKYTDQDSKIWHILSSGVNNILKDRTKNPGVYLFLHNDSSKLKNIVREIATRTSNCFDRSQLVEMKEHDFTSPNAMEDYGYAILKFKEKIQNGRVALIVNLNDIPAESAQALHTICDTYSPVAENIVIYLTLVIPSQTGNEINIARDTLNNLWGLKLKNNVLEPLVTRVTDQIITLH